MAKQSFHFTIGPVQGFVAQARRTRDIWAGSYLLSYLAGSAMAAIMDAHINGAIEFPDVKNDPLIRAIRKIDVPSGDRPEAKAAARIGSLPNRFKAVADDAPKVAQSAREAVKEAWENIAKVSLMKLEGQAKGLVTPDTRDMWARQVMLENQWEIAWVLESGDESDDIALLDRRKNLRTHFSEEEPGEKCTLCGERQALSKGRNDGRQAVKEWWAKVADQFNGKRGFHFRRKGKERLCAVCTIKRIFPLVAQDAIDWPVYHNYPSTGYMCAIDWLKVSLEKAEAGDEKIAEALEGFMSLAAKADVPFDETETVNQIPWIRDFVDSRDKWKPLLRFRGDVFFPDSIMNKDDFPIKEDIDNADTRNDLVAKLKTLTDTMDMKPTPFYAVLLMDGDNMGKLLSSHTEKQGKISKALAVFTSRVENIVETGHHGKLIYAGGDDVFAMLPLNTALDCARALQKAYMEAFSTIASDVPGASISAGIVYAHMNTALRAVVRDAHKLLDKTAKDEMGRNAFAVRVWKRGGEILTFAKKWEKDGTDFVCAVSAIRDALNRGEYSKGFLYRVRELEDILNTLTRDDQVKLLVAEYLKSREKLGLSEKPELRLQEAEERIRRVIALSDGKEKLSADGLLFVRFLAQKEV